MNAARSSPSTVATICARGGSKGLPGKNIRSFAGKPLIVHSIEQALACTMIDSVWVSTDDEKIATIARAAGAQVPFLRPAELASDTAPKIPAIEHLVKHCESTGLNVQRIVDLQPTSPLRHVSDIEGALQHHAQADLVVSVREATDNPYFNIVEADKNGWLHLSKGNGNTRRQDAPAVFALNGSIYVWQRAALAQAALQGIWSVHMAAYAMPAWRSVDIDDLDDFEYAQWLWHRHNNTKPNDQQESL
jgi:CMP-N,N'-diacetyllegionaminic acid synthase